MDLIDENYTLPPYKLNAVTDERSLAESKNAIMRLIPSHLSSLPVFNDNKRAYKPIEGVYTNKDGDFLINKQKSPKDLIETNIHATNVEHNKETIVTKRCFYNGTEYAIGDRWSDGCNATCVCAHPSRGHIICRNRCDEFNRLPPGCVQRMSLLTIVVKSQTVDLGTY
ncbi:hypothetical protein DPMN_008586 [Dreissena polymorpha]|uniref:Uncharacterized protein n=1 Tax=Dreissena polymorpha TaxID=45954 RepID=A0A9D4MYC8_DREPO|nr:hypothetical protein DPMN_008586 [Dreissena polymorpha]